MTDLRVICNSQIALEIKDKILSKPVSRHL